MTVMSDVSKIELKVGVEISFSHY